MSLHIQNAQNVKNIGHLAIDERRLSFFLMIQKIIQENPEMEYTVSEAIHAIALEANRVFNLYGKNNEAFFLSFFEIIKERRKREKIEKLSKEDPLTGLLNLRAAEEAFHLLNKRKSDNPVSIAFVDVDKLKYINDTFGHKKGDEILCCLANIFKEHLRPLDLAFRVGGDEFIIIFTAEPKEVERALVRILEEFKIKTKRASFSAGISSLRENDNLTAVKERADFALLQGKELGRSRIVIAKN